MQFVAKRVVLRVFTGLACGALAASATVTADASEHTHNGGDGGSGRWDTAPRPGVRAAKPVAYSIAEAGNQMVVGGRFTRVEPGNRGTDVDRFNVFAFDATDGAIHTGFKPRVDGQVWSVVSDGTSVYIGGTFRTVNGTTRAAVAMLDLATGTSTAPSGRH